MSRAINLLFSTPRTSRKQRLPKGDGEWVANRMNSFVSREMLKWCMWTPGKTKSYPKKLLRLQVFHPSPVAASRPVLICAIFKTNQRTRSSSGPRFLKVDSVWLVFVLQASLFNTIHSLMPVRCSTIFIQASLGDFKLWNSSIVLNNYISNIICLFDIGSCYSFWTHMVRNDLPPKAVTPMTVFY